MSISAVLFDSVVEVEISGPKDEFWDDLEQFKRDINWRDRKWDDYRKCWKVQNYRNYLHLDYIQEAVGARRNQLPLFDEPRGKEKQK